MAAPAVAGKLAIALAKNKTVRRVLLAAMLFGLALLVAPILLIGFVVVTVAAATPPPPEFSFGGGGWGHPLGAPTVWTTYEGHSNGAVDFPVPSGRPVYAAVSGTVFDLSESCGGIVIGVQPLSDLAEVMEAAGYEAFTPTVAHLSRASVSDGDFVKMGDLIGYSGDSGSCVDGAHLHFEMRTNPNPKVHGEFTPVYAFMSKRGVDLGPCSAGCTLYPMS